MVPDNIGKIYIQPTTLTNVRVVTPYESYTPTLNGDYLVVNSIPYVGNSIICTVYADNCETQSVTIIGEDIVYITMEERFYISKISKGSNTYIIKDAEARNSITNLATVATSGEYNDLINKPTIPAAQVQSDWNATSGMGVILNKPTLATVATSGEYSDLLNKPTIPVIDQSYSGTSVNAQSGVAVKSAIDSAISSVYKPAGSVAFANLPTPASTNLGNVYNMTDSFTTDSRFVEGSGKTYPAGSNVVIVEKTGETLYAWEVPEGHSSTPILPSGTVIYTTNETLSPSSHIYDINGNDVTSNYVINYPNPQGFPFAYFDIRFGVEPVYYYVEDEETNLITLLSRNSSLDVTGGYFFDVLAGFIDLSGYATTNSLANVATSGEYSDLLNKPSIPAAQVQSDWNATSGMGVILNKPTIPAAQVNSDWNATSGVAQILNKPTWTYNSTTETLTWG